MFALWTGMSAVSASLGRNVFVEQGHFTIYPNMFIILVAESAKCRKSSAIRLAKNLLMKVNPSIQVLSQKSSPEGLIEDLTGVEAEGNTTIISSATGIIIADELSTFIDANAFKSGMIALLTNLFDCDTFNYKTRSHGLEQVTDPCLSILGGSTMNWIKEAVPEVAIGGGFTARVIFVYEDKPERLIAWPEDTLEKKEMLGEILADLCQVAKLRGNFAFDNQAKEAYTSEYERWMTSCPMFRDRNLSGYAGRRHTLLLKVAMAVSASYNDSRLVTKSDVEVALNIMRQTEKKMPRVLSSISASPVGSLQEHILTYIIQSKVISRASLIKMTSNKITSRELDIILEGFMEARVVELSNRDGEIFYTFKGVQDEY